MPVPRDESTSEAIEILREAAKSERVPGVLEFGILDRALVAARDNPTEANMALADAAFRALDEMVRLRVADRALADAHVVAHERRGDEVTIAPPTRKRPPADTSGLPPLLRVVNRLREAKT